MPIFPFFSRFPSFSFAFSGAVAVFLSVAAPTQAQTPMFNVAEYAEYNGKTDAAASSFAADFARRSAVAPVRNADRPLSTTRKAENRPTSQNTPNIPFATRPSVSEPVSSNARSNAPKSPTAQIWEAFLFGTPNRSLSTPKFAFARRGGDSPVAVSRPQPSPSAQPLQSLQTEQTPVSPLDADVAAARRRRLQELNALLATRRPEEFSRRLALAEAASDANVESPADAKPALPLLVDAPVAERPDALLQERAEFVADDAPFDAARANRSKIRQASNLEPARPLELADDGFAAFLLPTRPNALRLSPNVFLSTDLVRLPSVAPLREIPENAPTSRSTQSAQKPQTSQTSPSRRLAQPVQPLPNAEPSPSVATPLPAASSTDVPTLRPTAQFVEPRFLPTRR